MKRIRTCLPAVTLTLLSLCVEATALAQGTAQQGVATAPPGPTLEVIRARRLIDKDVRNQAGEILGEVEDVMVDTANGRIAYVALDAGPLGPIFAIPWKALGVAADNTSATLNMAKDRLQKAPAFRREHWPDTVEPDWLASVYSYYGYPPYPGMTEITVKNMRLARATTLVGLTARDRQRQELGEIQDFTIDIREGHIAYVILATGGILGGGEQAHAVPWTAMEVRPVERVVVLNVDKKKLEYAPPLKEGVWEETASRRWLAGVYAYYGARPYWERGE
jgi:sporulation protein YlmC with PRC-barrel domain